MSEYQYFEWQAIDRLLTEQEVDEVAGLSSHMDVVSSAQAVVTYSWGDFKHDAKKVLLKYFDAALYFTNWGSRQLMFRFPADAIDIEQIEAYCLLDQISITVSGEYAVLDFDFGEEAPDDEMLDFSLAPFLALREQIMQGDYRALYLAWLTAIGNDAMDESLDDREPPVPAGLKTLSAGLREFTRFISLDPFVTQAAQAGSSPLKPVTDTALLKALPALTRDECEDYLRQMLQNPRPAANALRKRLTQLAGIEQRADASGRRTAAEMYHTAERFQIADQKRKQADSERKRVEQMEDLARTEPSVWAAVEKRLLEKNAKAYDAAIVLVIQLRDLASYKNMPVEFQQRLDGIKQRYSNRPAFMERLKAHGL